METPPSKPAVQPEVRPLSYWVGELREPEPRRSKAIEALARNRDSLPLLISAMTSGDVETANGAIAAIGKIGPAARAAIPHLTAALDNPVLRRSAVVALGDIAVREPTALTRLISLLVKYEEDPTVILPAMRKIDDRVAQFCGRLVQIDGELRVLEAQTKLAEAQFRRANAIGDAAGVQRAANDRAAIAKKRAVLFEEAETVLTRAYALAEKGGTM
ncbi:MAG: HEAT repeat domain-containing protein [Planctomycetes bacterium]|nr:HEAT repeat domain-containing protein [Planctomycetota bacterium]